MQEVNFPDPCMSAVFLQPYDWLNIDLYTEIWFEKFPFHSSNEGIIIFYHLLLEKWFQSILFLLGEPNFSLEGFKISLLFLLFWDLTTVYAEAGLFHSLCWYWWAFLTWRHILQFCELHYYYYADDNSSSLFSVFEHQLNIERPGLIIYVSPFKNIFNTHVFVCAFCFLLWEIFSTLVLTNIWNNF